MTPPTTELKTEPPTPTKKRAINMPAKLGITEHTAWEMTNTKPARIKTGRLPQISEMGASAMGAIAKPAQKVVIPTSVAVWLAPISLAIALEGGE
jgi:hypothetical protein